MSDHAWKLKHTHQCRHCPWRAGVDPYTIPNGYDADKHRRLSNTIAQPGMLALGEPLHVMTCHETADSYCIGWLVNQLGPGNNIALRLHMRSCTNTKDIKLRGEQHATFEDTLPPAGKRKSR